MKKTHDISKGGEELWKALSQEILKKKYLDEVSAEDLHVIVKRLLILGQNFKVEKDLRGEE